MSKKQTQNTTPLAVGNADVVIESLNVTVTTIEETVVIPSSETNEVPAATTVLKTRH